MLYISEIEDLNIPTNNKDNKTKISDFKKSLSEDITQTQYNLLKRLSNKIDSLIIQYYYSLKDISPLVNNNFPVWGCNIVETKDNKDNKTDLTYDQKQNCIDTYNKKGSAYYKLKNALDFWTSLYFWDYDNIQSLPKNYGQYLDALQMLLDSNSESQEEINKLTIIDNKDEYGNQYYNTPIAPEQTKDSKPPYCVVQELAEQYSFYHPMLEFIEVFVDKGGFDIIDGNPPWLSLSFKETAVMADFYPYVLTQKYKSPKIKTLAKKKLSDKDNKEFIDAYYQELISQECTKNFMTSSYNYPLLTSTKKKNKKDKDTNNQAEDNNKGGRNNLYKSVLTNCMDMLNENGHMGLLTPDAMYKDNNATALRRYLYQRLDYVFQYQNEQNLFADVAHSFCYCTNIIRGKQSDISFDCINNLYSPKTILGSYSNITDNTKPCEGLKDKDDNWNTTAHKDRIIHHDKNTIALISNIFENGQNQDCPKLVSIHSESIIKVLKSIKKIIMNSKKVSDYKNAISFGNHETMAVKNNIIKPIQDTNADIDKYQMIYKSPLIYIANPIYNQPRKEVKTNSSYDNIDLQSIDKDFMPRTLFLPVIDKDKNKTIESYKATFPSIIIDYDQEGNPIYGNSWIDSYKLAFRYMLAPTNEHTLFSAILPPKVAHTNGIISICFDNNDILLTFGSICSSIIMDFYLKIMGAQALQPNTINSFPIIDIPEQYKDAIFARYLMLNCLTSYYKDLWEDNYKDTFSSLSWSVEDDRLPSFSCLTPSWQKDNALRSDLARYYALLEIDVLIALCMNIDIKDLLAIYNIQFPVLNNYERNTYYDIKGNIVYSTSKNRGISTEEFKANNITWETIKDNQLGQEVKITRQSELYKGITKTYYPPFTKRDKAEDYTKAYNYFKQQFNKTK